jgi:hypothetical protein
MPSYHCGVIAVLLRQHCQLIINAAFIANFLDYSGKVTTPTLLWDHAAYKAV